MYKPVPLADNRSWIVPAILVVLGWTAQAFLGYHSTDMDLSNRVTAIEVLQRTDSANEKARLDRIEDKLDRVFEAITGRRP